MPYTILRVITAAVRCVEKLECLRWNEEMAGGRGGGARGALRYISVYDDRDGAVGIYAGVHASMARAVSDSVAFSLNLVSCRRRH